MKRHLYCVAVILIFVAGCAQIPRQSVNLSENIGAGIAETHRAYLGMVNLYFDQKRDAIDQWIDQKYLPLYISTVRSKLVERKADTNSFDEALTADIIRRVVQKRNQMQAELEKSRTSLVNTLESNHAILSRANNELTALLQSAVKVEEANSALAATLQDVSGGKVDFDLIDQKFNEYLDKAGTISETTVSLYQELRPLIHP